MPWWSGGRPKNKLSPEYLASLCSDVIRYSENPNSIKKDAFIEVIRQMAEILVWGDSVEEGKIFDVFLEKNMLPYLTELMCSKVPADVQNQLLQTLYILIQNVRSPVSIFYLLSGNHINKLIMYEGFDFVAEDELLSHFVNFLKSLSLRLDVNTIQCFYNRDTDTFPLYTATEKILNFCLRDANSNPTVKAAVRAIVVHMCQVDDPYVINYVVRTAAYTSTVFRALYEDATNLDRLVGQPASPQTASASHHLPVTIGVFDMKLDDLVDDFFYINDLLQIEKPELRLSLYDNCLSFSRNLRRSLCTRPRPADRANGRRASLRRKDVAWSKALTPSLAFAMLAQWVYTIRDNGLFDILISGLLGREPTQDCKLPPPPKRPKVVRPSGAGAIGGRDTIESFASTADAVQSQATDVTGNEADAVHKRDEAMSDAVESESEVAGEAEGYEAGENDTFGTQHAVHVDPVPAGGDSAVEAPSPQPPAALLGSPVRRDPTEACDGTDEASPQASSAPQVEGSMQSSSLSSPGSQRGDPLHPERWLLDVLDWDANVEDLRTPQAAMCACLALLDSHFKNILPDDQVEALGLTPRRKRAAPAEPLPDVFPALARRAAAPPAEDTPDTSKAADGEEEEGDDDDAADGYDDTLTPHMPQFLRQKAPTSIPAVPSPPKGHMSSAKGDGACYPTGLVEKLLLWMCNFVRNAGRVGRLEGLEVCCRVLCLLLQSKPFARPAPDSRGAAFGLGEYHATLLRDAYSMSRCLIRHRLEKLRYDSQQRRQLHLQQLQMQQQANSSFATSAGAPARPPPAAPDDPNEMLFLLLAGRCETYKRIAQASVKQLLTRATLLVAPAAEQASGLGASFSSPPPTPSPMGSGMLAPATPVQRTTASAGSSPVQQGGMQPQWGTVTNASISTAGGGMPVPPPGVYRIIGRSGAKVRKDRSMESKLLTQLRPYGLVEVAEIKERRCRIVAPVGGWISMWNSVNEMILEQVDGAVFIPPLTVPVEQRTPCTEEEVAEVEVLTYFLVRNLVHQLTGRPDALMANLSVPDDGPMRAQLGEWLPKGMFKEVVRCQLSWAPPAGSPPTSYTVPDFAGAAISVLHLALRDNEVLLLQSDPKTPKRDSSRLVAALPLFHVYLNVDERLGYRLRVKCKTFMALLSFEKAPYCQQVAARINQRIHAIKRTAILTMFKALQDDAMEEEA